MPKVDQAVDDDTDIEQSIGKAAFLYPRYFEDKGAQKNQSQRQQHLDQQGGRQTAQNGVHQRICLIKPAACEQRFGAKPVNQIQRI